jgi:hypothetical protein
LAVRFKCPIYTYEDIMDAAGVTFNQDLNEVLEDIEAPAEKPKPKEAGKEYTKMNLEQLQNLLENALGVEDYVTAAKIRDEIQRREA